jgi:hypothetical protein
VELHLVDRRDNVRALAQRRQVMRHEVADPDGPHPHVAEEPLERAVRLDRALEVLRHRLVEDQQVDLGDAELGRALVECVQGLVVAVVADPDLRLDEDVPSIKAGAADASPTSRSFPYPAAVSMCR